MSKPVLKSGRADIALLDYIAWRWNTTDLTHEQLTRVLRFTCSMYGITAKQLFPEIPS